MKQDVPPSTGI